MAAAGRKLLLVEGKTDLYAIVELMAKHVQWGDRKEDRPVIIEAVGSADEVLTPHVIPTYLKSREVEILGVVVDANDAFEARWRAVRNLCEGEFSNIPQTLPNNGLILQNDNGKRLGVWIMPDNASRGMLETFMRFLVPNDREAIWLRAQTAVSDAMAAGAKCRECHRDKANMYTWLAWQDPPGQRVGEALMQNMLDAHAPYAAPFVTWFCDLFQLARL